ncbi:hypothetical protein OO007_19970 [Cocleimonas sp. KMM 6892]|uniref:hypothetical protein n=1 Tax=unclassified Cocleimonas TaxID=2639732 RepID=UPI002DBB1CB2|nr:MULTISPECIES: hypothetical protein [unclassified Cocleimonas]MEB8434526.1 hypothetical protein [Cocleimonas sp. KMM 6892]MEC4717419.1 hypothetical protein [Cocleimonas sp. KMM 6895]MEC4746787.1 hypothetical protein [Cocleimonas sp. KMM 6896]
MKAGYLAIEAPPKGTNDSGLVKLLSWDQLPDAADPNQDDTNQANYPENVHYVARFNDILAAGMHFHNGLRRQLVDINEKTYRAELTHAIAVIEAESDLRHERIWMDPAIDQNDLEAINQDADKIRSKKKKINLAIKILGFIAIAILIFNAIAPML